MEEIIWCQRARSKWLKEGDTNTGYFHRVANMRHKSNAIRSLNTPKGGPIVGEDLKRHIYEHFLELFGWTENKRIKFLKELWPPQNNLIELDKGFFEEEIKKAIWDLGHDKAPGPDDFPIFSFRTFWSTIKEDLLNMFKELNNGCARLDKLNYSFIELLPKRNSPESITEYCPIALLNSMLKIFSKMLASRLTPPEDRWYTDELHSRT